MMDDKEDAKSVFSDVKSDIFNENKEKFLIQINEWFTLIFIMLAHNKDAKDLALDSDEEGDDDLPDSLGEETIINKEPKQEESKQME